MSKTYIPENVRRQVIETHTDHCFICGESNKVDLHHIIPEYANGPTTVSNLVPLCSNKLGKDSCHTVIHRVYTLKEKLAQGNLTPAEYYSILDFLRR